MPHQLILIFDGLKNTVFDSQVLEPALKLAQAQPGQIVTIISFEVEPKAAQLSLDRLGKLSDNLQIIIYPRLPFWGAWTLKLAAHQLKNWLIDVCQKWQEQPPIEPWFEITCRGVFSANILRFALQMVLSIQALQQRIKLDDQPWFLPVYKTWVLLPGIASAECRLLIDNNRLQWWQRQLAWVKGYLLGYLAAWEEAKIFTNFWAKQQIIMRFVACSQAMKEYLVQTQASAANADLFVAQNTTASFTLDIEQKLHARKVVREKLGISYTAALYAYCGGMQSWQNFDLCVAKFLEILNTNQQAKFLVLTTDPTNAKQIMMDQKVPPSSYVLLSVASQEVHNYLLACDYGFLVRQPNLVNFTARPIKVLEYQKASLLVIHNYTVAWVCASNFKN